MIYWKQYDILIKILIDLSIRFCQEIVDEDEIKKFFPLYNFIESVIDYDSNESNFISRIYSNTKNIGSKTKQLSQAICFSIQNLNNFNSKKASYIAIFWLRQLIQVIDWKNDNRIWYIINEISKVLLLLKNIKEIIEFLIKHEEFQ
jgi:hypothetical protein